MTRSTKPNTAPANIPIFGPLLKRQPEDGYHADVDGSSLGKAEEAVTDESLMLPAKATKTIISASTLVEKICFLSDVVCWFTFFPSASITWFRFIGSTTI